MLFSWLIIKHHMRMCGGQITGKALMLDEIINYVQSLQSQVEVYDKLVKCCKSSENGSIERLQINRTSVPGFKKIS